MLTQWNACLDIGAGRVWAVLYIVLGLAHYIISGMGSLGDLLAGSASERPPRPCVLHVST